MRLLPRLVLILGWAAMLAGLTLTTVTPEVANVATLALMGVGLLVLVYVPDSRDVLRQPSVRVPLAAGLLLLIALAVTAKSPMHIIAIMILAPLWFAGGLAGLLTQLGRWLTPLTIASFALAGAAGGAAIAAFDVLMLGDDRGGWLVNNPIHLADLSLMLGFVALVGVLDRRPIRLIFLAGPALSLICVWFSGSRGPLLAFVPMVVLGSATLGLMVLSRRATLFVVTLVVAAVLVGGYFVIEQELGGRLGEIGELGDVMRTGSAKDASTSERLYMYGTAWNAFLASPWVGHGMIDYPIIASQYASPGPSFPPSQHMHSDLADFAVIGGGLGLLSYALLILAPFVGGLAVRGPNRNAAIYLGIMASVGYVAMGLTNAMLGILTQTVVYAVILALIATLGTQRQGETT